jgi:hypothetical protein
MSHQHILFHQPQYFSEHFLNSTWEVENHKWAVSLHGAKNKSSSSYTRCKVKKKVVSHVVVSQTFHRWQWGIVDKGDMCKRNHGKGSYNHRGVTGYVLCRQDPSSNSQSQHFHSTVTHNCSNTSPPLSVVTTFENFLIYLNTP